MSSGGRVHDRSVLDALEKLDPEPFDSDVWRVARKGRDPLRGSSQTAMGRAGRTGSSLHQRTARRRFGRGLASDFLSNRCGRASFNTRYIFWLSGRSARCASSTCANWQILASISPDMKHLNMALRKRSRPPHTFWNSTACWCRVHGLRARIWCCLQTVFRTPEIFSS